MANQKEHKSKIGGQALIEGVMMKGVKKGAMACRLPNGTIDIETWDENNGKNAPWYRKTPFVRGVFNMVDSMFGGYKCLMKSADKQMTDDDDDEEQMSKFEKWLSDKLGDKVMPIVSVISIVLSLIMVIVLFKFLPSFAGSLVREHIIDNNLVITILEGVLKIGIFVAYLAVTALMKDIKRTYEYHGAEHKTIFCFEKGEELIVENVKKQQRFHPRCGTSFLLIVLVISIFVYSFITITSVPLRIAVQLALLPVVVGISYEIIRLAGKFDNPFTRLISAPGLCLQRLTTREPDDKQIEVAIAAIKPCLPENLEEDKW